MIYASSEDEVLQRSQYAYILSGGIGDYIKALYHGMPDETSIWLVSMEGYIDDASWMVRLNAAIELLSEDDRVIDVVIFRRGGEFESDGYGGLVSLVHELAEKNNQRLARPPITKSELVLPLDTPTRKLIEGDGRPMMTILPYAGGHRRGSPEFLRRLSASVLDDGYGIVYVGDRRFPNGDMTGMNSVIDEMVPRGAIDLTKRPTMRSTWTAAKLSKFRLSDHTMGMPLFSLIPSGSVLLSRIQRTIEALRYYVLNYDESKNLYVFEDLPYGRGLEGAELADYVVQWMRDRS